jgi:hypothetical protein
VWWNDLMKAEALLEARPLITRASTTGLTSETLMYFHLCLSVQRMRTRAALSLWVDPRMLARWSMEVRIAQKHACWGCLRRRCPRPTEDLTERDANAASEEETEERGSGGRHCFLVLSTHGQMVAKMQMERMLFSEATLETNATPTSNRPAWL